MNVLVIVPAFNEEHSLEQVVDDLRRHVPGAEVLVVDDGSTDGTARVARDLGVTLVRSPFNLGIGATVQTGYRYARRNGYDAAVQFDGDGQHPAEQVPALLRPLLDGSADLAIGSRFLENRTNHAQWSRLLGIRILSTLICLLVKRRITDPTSGFRALNRRAIEYCCRHYPDDYPEPEAVVLLHRAGLRIVEIPVEMRERMAGSSTITFVRGAYYMIKVCLAILVDMLKRVDRVSVREKELGP